MRLNNDYRNLEWTTISANTKHAYNMGLAKNAKGIEDSQSIPIYIIDYINNTTTFYGSIGEASRATHIYLSTLARLMRGNRYSKKYNIKVIKAN